MALCNLPTEILVNIIEYTTDIVSIQLVCKLFCEVSRSNSIWKKLFNKTYHFLPCESEFSLAKLSINWFDKYNEQSKLYQYLITELNISPISVYSEEGLHFHTFAVPSFFMRKYIGLPNDWLYDIPCFLVINGDINIACDDIEPKTHMKPTLKELDKLLNKPHHTPGYILTSQILLFSEIRGLRFVDSLTESYSQTKPMTVRWEISKSSDKPVVGSSILGSLSQRQTWVRYPFNIREISDERITDLIDLYDNTYPKKIEYLTA